MSSVFKSITNSTSTKSQEDAPLERKNKQRVLVLSSRGVTYRQRHLLNDLASLLPHARKDAKLDTKSKLFQLNELAELYNCNNILFFEARKRQDLYLWMSKAPNGPCIKMHVQNLHTMEELHFTGNCLKGSRPILSFDANFDASPYSIVIKELLTHIFGVPKGARKSKPFVDHIMSFTLADGKIWIRCYQIEEKEDDKQEDEEEEEEKDEEETTDADGKKKNKNKDKDSSKSKKSKKHHKGGELDTTISLLEIGPRLVLTPIVIQEGSFGGPIIYENKEFVSPNVLRSEYKNRRAAKFDSRMDQKVGRDIKKKVLKLDKHRVGGGAGKDWEEQVQGLTGLFD